MHILSLFYRDNLRARCRPRARRIRLRGGRRPIRLLGKIDADDSLLVLDDAFFLLG